MGSNDTYFDLIFFKDLSESLQDIFDGHSNDDLPDMKVDHNEEMNSKLIKVGKNNQSYIDWALKASKNPYQFNKKCIRTSNPFYEIYTDPSEESNAAIAIEISLSKANIKGDLRDSMGNELALIDSKHPKALKGIIPSVIYSIRQFLEVMNPFISLKKLEVGYSDSNFKKHEKTVDYVFEANGCMSIGNVKEISPAPKEIDFHFIDDGLVTTFTLKFGVKTVYSNEINLKLSEQDFALKINCLPTTKNIKYKDFYSLFLTKKFNNVYNGNKRSNRMEFSNLEKYKITNVNMELLPQSLIFEQSNMYSEIFQENNLLLQFGRFFPITLTYNPPTSEITYEIYDKKIPELKDGLNEAMNETGILSKTGYLDFNHKFIALLNELKLDVSDINIGVFNDYRTFACSEIDKEIFQTKEEQNNTQKFVKEEKWQTINQMCKEFKGDNRDEIKKRRMFLNINSNKKMTVLPSFFLGLIGRQIKLSFDAPKKKILDNGISQNMEINGKIVLVDYMITGDSKTNKFIKWYNSDKMLQYPVKKYLMLPSQGIGCNCVNPFSPVNMGTLSNVVDRLEGKKENPRYFYSIRITPSNLHSNKAVVSLYTNMVLENDDFNLYDKRKKFNLPRNHNKTIYMNGEFKGEQIYIYQNEFDKSELGFLGLFVILTLNHGERHQFDCFMNGLDKGFTVNKEFILYKSILNKMAGIEHENKTIKKSRRQQKIIWYSVIGLGVLVSLGLLGWGVYYYLMGSKGEKEEKVEDKDVKDTIPLE
jgi:hypothetical protein